METDTRADEMSYVPIPEKELDLLRRSFADNDALLKAMRAVMLGLTPTAEEKAMVRESFSNPELFRLVSYRFLPYLDKNAEIGTLQDVWLGVETMVFGQNKDIVYQATQYKDLAIDMTREALALLVDPSGVAPTITYTPKSYPMDELGIKLLARNMFLRHVEKQLGFLKIVGSSKKETRGEEKDRLEADSNK